MTRYDEKTALVVVDMQNDFADPKGSLYVQGGEALVDTINREIEAASRAGALVVYSRDWHPEVTPHFEKYGGVWPVHCVGGSWGSDFHPHLKVLPDAPEIHKGTGGEDGYSAFSMRHPESGEILPTQLESILRAREIERVVLVGLATDYCVKETALDGLKLGFAVTVLASGVGAVDLEPGDGVRAIEAVAAAGARVE
jgi:nicotinamidase/pyrazinamidase